MTEKGIPLRDAEEIEPSHTPSANTLTGLAVGVVIVAALYFGEEILLPVTLAVLLSFVLSPLVRLLRHINIPRVVAVVFSVGLALAVVAGVGTLVASQMVQVAGDLPRYQTTIEHKVDALRSASVGRLSEFANRFQGALGPPANQLNPPGAGSPEAKPGESQPAPVPVEVRQPPPDPLSLARRILTPVLHPLATAAIIFIVAVFILMQQDDLRDRMIRLFGARDLHRTTLAMDDAARRLSRYFLVQLGINASFGVIIGIGLFFIGLPSPLLWGTIAALLRFVPYIGSYVGAAMPVLLAAAVDPGWTVALEVAALFLVTEPILGQVVEPMLYGRSTGLSPLSVVISAIFWGWLWGPVGLILSTPLTLCLVVLGRHVEQLEFLQVLLGDRPALTNVENFYQRVLAGDSDEVQEHAEALLKEMSLSCYYDEVALPGLELAAHDLARRVLTRPQLERIRKSVHELVGELDSYDDVDPEGGRAASASDGSGRDEEPVCRTPVHAAPDPASLAPIWRCEVPVRCIAGKGPLDEASATILAQLLTKHGIGARVVAQDAVSRNAITGFECDDVAMICICYLDMTGATSPLRFLIRRLRRRAPGARLLVGMWPHDHTVMTDKALQHTLGADDYVTSLREAVQACVAARDESAGSSEAATEPAPAVPLQVAAAHESADDQGARAQDRRAAAGKHGAGAGTAVPATPPLRASAAPRHGVRGPSASPACGRDRGRPPAW